MPSMRKNSVPGSFEPHRYIVNETDLNHHTKYAKTDCDMQIKDAIAK